MRPRRRNAATDPLEALVATLPDDLRTFDNYRFPNGLHAFMSDLSRFIGGDQRVFPVMNAAGLSVAAWYKAALGESNENMVGI